MLLGIKEVMNEESISLKVVRWLSFFVRRSVLFIYVLCDCQVRERVSKILV